MSYDSEITMKISVVIPAYNASDFLPRCLSSVFAQTVRPHEVFVVDDGSADSTASLAANIGACVLQRANGGLSAARNTGLKHAAGHWVALLDADDWWAPEKLGLQLHVIDSMDITRQGHQHDGWHHSGFLSQTLFTVAKPLSRRAL